MPTVRIPLVGSYNERGLAGNAALVASEDQRFLNAVFDVVTNPVTGKSTVYLSKRPGWGVDSIVAVGSASTGILKTQSFSSTMAAFGNTDSTIYLGTISVGTITGKAQHFTETLVSSVGHVVIKSSDGTGWYYVDGAKDVTAYTMDGNNSTTVTDIKIAGVNSTAGLYSGQKLTAATNITAGTRIVSVNAGAFTAVLDTATTGGAFNDLAVTKEPIAKIIDADFVTTGAYNSAFVALDGYLFYTTEDGNLRNSDLNSVTAYTSTSSIPVQMSPDKPVGVAVQNNAIVAFGLGSKEVFQNAGLSSGSPLQRITQPFQRIGCLDQRSLTQLEDDIYFVSTPFEGDIGVYRMRGLTATKVSTPTVDRLIGTVSPNGAIYASSFKLGGQSYAAFSISTAFDGPNSLLLLESGEKILLESGDDIVLEDTPASVASYVRTLVYNINLNVWSEWDCNQATFIDGVSIGTGNQILATSRFNTGGEVYTINPTSDGQLYQDDGVTYTMEVRTAKIDFGTGRYKYFDTIELLGVDMSSGSQPYISWSDDDYQTWSTPRPFDMSGQRPKINRGGATQGQRAFKITEGTNNAFRAEALSITYKEGVL